MARRLPDLEPGEAIRNFVNDQSDPRLPRLLATHSTISPPHAVHVHDHRQVGSRNTSMMLGGSSLGTRQDSLPALTLATSGQTSSIPSSIGARAGEDQLRILEEDQYNGGVLTVPPMREHRVLECPFNLAFLCPLTFSNEKDWLDHSLLHLRKNGRPIAPPTTNHCCFCERKFDSDMPYHSWAERMRHVSLHHALGHRLAHARPDFALFEYLFKKRLISDGDYRDLMGNARGRLQRIGYLSPPASPDSPRAPSTSFPVEVTNRGRRGERRQ